MRIAIVDTYYPPFLRAVYRSDPGLAEKPYDAQLAHHLSLFFGTSDAYSSELRRMGHETIDVIANCIPLQRSWLKSRPSNAMGLRLMRSVPTSASPANPIMRAWLASVVREQLAEFDPDVVYLQNPMFMPPRLAGGGRWLVVGQLASPPRWPRLVRQLDLLVTSFPHYVELWQAKGVDTVYLPLAFDSRVAGALEGIGVNPAPDAPRTRQFAFVGGLDPQVHASGVAVLEHLISEGLPIDFFGYGADKLDPRSRILERYKGEAWGLDLYRVYAESEVVINRHIAAAGGFANNMRMFEATGVGAALMTESTPNLPGLFAPGTEVETYADSRELVLKARGLMAAPIRRVEIATAGRDRTMADHTYTRRVKSLAAILEARLGSRRVAGRQL